VTDAEVKAELHRYLRTARDALLWKLDGLSEYDIRRPMTPTGTNLLGLVKHLTGAEQDYFGTVFDRPFAEPVPWADALDNSDMWATAEESREYIVGLYRRVCAHADATIGALALDAVGHVPWWMPGKVTLHRILVHVTAETHRHAAMPTSSASSSTGRWGCAPTSTTWRKAIRRGGRPTAAGWNAWRARRATADAAA
jgi:hypothetical protein